MKNELSLEAKEAVRKYLLGIFAVPSIILTTIAFIAGFLINDIARKDAYNDAYNEAWGQTQTQITNLLLQVSQAVSESTQSKEYIELTRKRVDDVLTETKKLKDDLSNFTELQTATDATEEIADILSKRDDFKIAVSGDLDSKIEKVEDGLSELSSRYSAGLGRKQCELVDSAQEGGDLWCKPGWYVAGAKNHPRFNHTLDKIYCCQR